MRLQHNISPPAPGRGGSRKRKRATDDQGGGPVPPGQPQLSPAPSSSGGGGFNTFKVEPGTPSETDERGEYFMHPPPPITNGRSMSPSFRPPLGDDEEQEGYTSSDDTIPAHLMSQYEPSTGLILGRSPAMVMYLLMKAKHQYALTQHEDLCEQLKVVRQELRKEREEKEGALNAVLRTVFGGDAESVIQPITPPPGMSPEEVQAAITGPAFNAAVGGSGGGVAKYPPVGVTNGNGR
ncbi:hypothetical protein BDQ17DRAFT_1353838 [Cyathus striatus]|nr:hypothetical protein BDQ17DRAFT_1353838 [Cyathus striatus]